MPAPFPARTSRPRIAAMRWAVLVSLALAAAPAAGGDRDFTFRRVPVPGPGDRPPLVQIDPAAQARWLAPTGPPRSEGDAEGSVPSRAAGRDHMATALAAIPHGGSWASGAGATALRRIAERHGAAILQATNGTRVSPTLALAVIAVESGGRVQAVSPAGAEGLMQLMPATARRFGVTDSLSGSENIHGGVAYLDWLLRRFDGDPVLALAGYNAGEGAVDDHGGMPPYAETRRYVPRVLAAVRAARSLCVMPPDAATGGCALAAARRSGAG